AERPIRAPSAQNERVIGLRQRETCLRIARLGGTLEDAPRRTDRALAKQHIRAGHQPCHLDSILKIRLGVGSGGRGGSLDRGNWLDRIRSGLLVSRDPPGGGAPGYGRYFFCHLRRCKLPLQPCSLFTLLLQRS